MAALVEAALVERNIPGARPVVDAIIFVGVAADLTPAEFEVGVPFAGWVGDAGGSVAVSCTLIVTAGGLSVEDEIFPHVRAEDGACAVEDAILASVWAVRSVRKNLAAIEVGAFGGVKTSLNLAVVAVGIAHAGEGVVADAFAGALFVDVGPSGRSVLVTSDILLCPGFEIGEEGGDDFAGLDGVDVVDFVGDGLLVLVDEVPVSVGNVVGVADGSKEDLTSVLSDGGVAGQVGGSSHV